MLQGEMAAREMDKRLAAYPSPVPFSLNQSQNASGFSWFLRKISCLQSGLQAMRGFFKAFRIAMPKDTMANSHLFICLWNDLKANGNAVR
jgi:hypothetical protein